MNSWIAAVLNSFWQALGIAGCVWAVLKFAPRLNAATRHAVWWAVLGVVILLPAASVLIERRQGPRNPAGPSAVPGMIASPVPAGPARFPSTPPVQTRRAAPIEVRAGVWPVLLTLVRLAVVLFP